MTSRLIRMNEKLQKYLQKLNQTSYYLTAQILNSECRTSFLKDSETGLMTIEQQQKLMKVRKL